ncbi:rho guanine nucleotide exchange factor 12-like, partial [Notothenia coriiceps]|uniref:Rho guanine nucleotide exchange factor 12-like n=1 Tax=Notothenia coriiceps TaxID=8208 RepID=A0A6I9PK36_9TELE
GKAVEMNKQRSPKPLPPASLLPEQPDPPSGSARSRGNLSDGSDAGTHSNTHSSPSNTHSSSSSSSNTHTSPTLSPPPGHLSDSGHDSDSNVSPFCLQPRLGDVLPVENQDGVCSPTGSQFDFSASNLEQLVEEDPDPFRMEVQCPVSSDVQSEEDQGERESEAPPLNWQSLVSRGVLESLTPQEIKRQEVIN